MLTLVALLACTEPEAPLPEMWGVDALEDQDDAPGVVEVHLSATKSERSWLDGETTPVWTYSGQIPGPLIHAWVGDTLRVVFTNELDVATTIHWHGLRIPDDMDGSPRVREPVQPGETFTYEFTLPDAGSYWYHPHVRAHEQIERGLQGVLVVHEREPVAVDRDRYFVVDDVQLEDDGSYTTFAPNALHMNAMMGRHGNVLLVNGQTDALTDTVRPGGVERWRVVNTANGRLMWLDVTGARWRVVALDGALLPEPFETTRVELPIGRRVDLEVIPDPDAETTQLRVNLPKQVGWDTFPVFEGAVAGEPGTGERPSWPSAGMPEIRPPEQEVELDLDATQEGSFLYWTINGVAHDHGEELHALHVQGNVPTRIRIREHSGIAHPFHLHGQFFQVVERNGGPAEPGLLDTVLVGGDEEVVLATDLDNPGQWMAHCHILEHAELGMMTELVVAP